MKRVLLLILFVLLSSVPFTYLSSFNDVLSVGQKSERFVYAPKSTIYEDKHATKAKQKEVLSTVQDVFYSDENIKKNALSSVSIFFDSVKSVREEALRKTETPLPTIDDAKKVTNPFGLQPEQILRILLLDDTDRQFLREVSENELGKVYDTRIGKESLPLIQKSFRENAAFYFFSRDIREPYLLALSGTIQPNLILNKAETEKLKRETLKSVLPVMVTIKKGDILLSPGDEVTEESYTKLVQSGVVDEQTNVKKLLVNLPFVASVFLALFYYLEKRRTTDFEQTFPYLYMLLTYFVVIQFDYVMSEPLFTLLPFLTIVMVYTLFWGRHFGFVNGILLAILVSGGDFSQIVLFLAGAVLLYFLFENDGTISHTIRSGFLIGLGLSLVDAIIQLTFLHNGFSPLRLLLLFVLCIVSTACLFVISMLSEKSLGLITPYSLNELTKSTHPLIKLLQTNAPGTYGHSAQVAILSELAADKIGANSLLLRVAAYYHDVGKTLHPEFYIENSNIENNPHKHLTPIESAKIILAHPHESVRLCEEHGIPKNVRDIILSHHSSGTLRHFYLNERDTNPDAKIEDFQYTTPKPVSKEASILFLADSTEAYSRTIAEKPRGEFIQCIRDRIREKLDDGLLSESELTIADVEQIMDQFITYLLRSNHKRMPYRTDK